MYVKGKEITVEKRIKKGKILPLKDREMNSSSINSSSINSNKKRIITVHLELNKKN